MKSDACVSDAFRWTKRSSGTKKKRRRRSNRPVNGEIFFSELTDAIRSNSFRHQKCSRIVRLTVCLYRSDPTWRFVRDPNSFERADVAPRYRDARYSRGSRSIFFTQI